MSCLTYILNDAGEVVPCEDARAWATWFEKADRLLVLTELPDGNRVSTVFLGIASDFGLTQEPMLWETYIYEGPHAGVTDRYTSADAARVGHELWVLVAKGETTPEAIREMERALA